MITLVERCSSFAVLCPVKDRSPAALNAPVKEKFAYRRGLARETLTVDQGREFADRLGLAKGLPVRLNGSVRWRKREMLAWIDAGLPPREKWEQIQNGQIKA